MRTYDSGTTALLAARQGLIAYRLFWIQARDRTTGDTVPMGLWSGEYDTTFDVEGEVRAYTGAGAILQGEPITATSGLEVRTYQMALAAVAAEVEDLVKGYETRFAPVEVHRALFDPADRGLVGTPARVFRGLCNAIDFPRAAPGEAPTCTMDLVSETRALTRGLALKKSDESQQARGGDRFRRYASISGSVPIYWGELRVSAPADPAPTAPGPSGRNYEDER